MPIDDNRPLDPIFLLGDEPPTPAKALELGMESWARVVAGVAVGTDGPFTIGVYGRWGTGKTSVLYRACHLASTAENTEAFVVNAWQHERAEDPLAAIVAEISGEIDRRMGAVETTDADVKASRYIGRLNNLRKIVNVVSVITQIGKVGGAVTALAFPPAAPAALSVAGGATAVEGSVKAMQETLKGEVEVATATKDALQQRPLNQQAIVNARAQYAPNSRIVIFVDDLDRCHPDKAVMLLESIKHLLWIPGFVFVLALDNEVVERYLDKRYKEDFGLDEEHIGRKYLQKLVQLTLPVPAAKGNFEPYVEGLAQQLAEQNADVAGLQLLVAAAAELNPRQAKRLFNNLAIDLRLWESEKPGDFEAADVLACLAVHRMFREIMFQAAYLRLVNNQEACDQLLRILDGVTADDEPTVPKDAEASRSEFDGIAKSLRERGLEELFRSGAAGRIWLVNEELRVATHSFLAITRQEDLGTQSDQDIVITAIDISLQIDTGVPVGAAERARVQSLYLAGSGLTSLQPIKELKQLTKLDLDNTQVSDLEPIKELKQLTELYLSGTQVTDLSPIKELKQLTTLGLYNSQVSDLAPIKELKQLTTLYLSYTQVSDLEPIKELKQLTELYLSYTRVSDLEPIKELKQLAELYLSNTQVSDLSPIKALKQLTTLYLSNTQVSDLSPIKELKQLTALYLSNTRVSDLEPIKELKQLTTLYLSNTQVSEAQKEDLKKHLPNLTIHG